MGILLTLICTGAFLVFLEIVLPGGIAGFIGGALFAFAIGYAWYDMGFVYALLVALVCSVIAVAALFSWQYVLPRTSFGRKLLPAVDTLEAAENTFAKFIGSTCVAKTDLMPTGRVVLDDEIFDAQCVAGFVSKGQTLKVVGADLRELKVAPINPELAEKKIFADKTFDDSDTLERQVFDSANSMQEPLKYKKEK